MRGKSGKGQTMNSKESVFFGLGWSYAEKLLMQVSGFVLSIVLARILSPEDYGVLSLANIIIGIASAIALTGFGSALIQKKDATDEDFSSTLFVSMCVSVIIYICLFLVAPYVARLFESPVLESVIRVASLLLVISSFNTVQHAYVIRQMKFKLFFISTLVGTLASAAVGLWMAYGGYGVWALVAQSLVNALVHTVVLFFLSDWKPSLSFSAESAKNIYGFGWKVMLSAILDAIYFRLRGFAIGLKYSAVDLAFYDRGYQFPNALVEGIDGSIANVIMPALSREQDNRARLKSMVRRGVKTSSAVLFPLLLGLAACAQPLVVLLLTDKWVDCVPYMQLLCVAMMFRPVQTANMQGILAIGRSDTYLRIKVIQKVIGVIVIIVTVFAFDSVLAIAVGEVVSYLSFTLVLAIPNQVLLQYSIREQAADILPQLILALVMAMLVYSVSMLPLEGAALVFLQLIAGALFYLLFARLIKIDSILYVVGFLKETLARHVGGNNA